MFSRYLFAGVFGVALVVSASSAQAVLCNPSSEVGCLTKNCSTLGATQMNKEKTDILACLQETSAANSPLVWKSNSDSGSASGKWVDIPMDNAPFSTACAHRAFATVSDVWGTIVGSNQVLYSAAVSSSAMIYVAHSGAISYIPFNRKNEYWVAGNNGTYNAVYPHTVIDKIQRSCP